MVYREQDEREICGSCSSFAVAHCPRCGQPRCEDHRLDDDRRCETCEAEFGRLIVRGERSAVSRMVMAKLGKLFLEFAVPFGVAAALVGVLVSWELAAIIAVGAGAIFWPLVFAALWSAEEPDIHREEMLPRYRRQFLAERKCPQLSAALADVEVDPDEG